ncbi:MAG: NAD(P)H-hydrate epimerase [Endomicrobiales bacterium]|nr:NAD(P)H-hydrate epimerase [Endomicrobiales bacterium]
MSEIDRAAAEKYGIPSIVLMENAGRAAAEICFGLLGLMKEKRVAVFCGSGNNGGDGFVVARHLHNNGFEPDVYLSKPPVALKGDALVNYAICKKSGVKIKSHSGFSINSRYGLIVDALLGTGAKGGLRAPYGNIIKNINRHSALKVSIDIPSGLDAGTGRAAGVAVIADVTVTMGIHKRGMLKKRAKKYTGEIVVADIGLPRRLKNQQ